MNRNSKSVSHNLREMQTDISSIPRDGDKRDVFKEDSDIEILNEKLKHILLFKKRTRKFTKTYSKRVKLKKTSMYHE